VFFDFDDSGIQEAGEPGIPGVLVELLDAAGAVIASTNTDMNGDYYFGDLMEGTYQVQVTPDPMAPRSSTPTSTADDDVDGRPGTLRSRRHRLLHHHRDQPR